MDKQKEKHNWLCDKFGHKWVKIADKNYKTHTFVCTRCGETQTIKQRQQ